MKIEESQITKLHVSEVQHLDPIDIYLEDYKPGWGKVVISCYGESWSYTWNAMGKDRCIRKFLIDCDEEYICGKLFSGDRWQTDFDAIPDFIRKETLKTRKDERISKEEARAIYDFAAEVERVKPDDHAWFLAYLPEEVSEAWPDLPWELPLKSSDKYDYLHRIVGAVQEALRAAEIAQGIPHST